MVHEPPDPVRPLRPVRSATAGRLARILAILTVATGLAAGPHVAHAGVARTGPEEPLPDVTDVPDPAPDAEPDDPMRERAMTAYKEGTDAFNAGRYEDALAAFKEASSLYASPDFQYNIARCYEELGKHEEAVRAFETYLKAKPNAEDRGSVENRIKLLEKLIAEENKRKQDEANRKPTVIVQQVGEDKSEKRRKAAKPLIIAGAAIAGVGGLVALGGGIGFGAAARSRSNDLDDVQNGGNPENLTFADAQTLSDEGQRFETLQLATVGAGAGLAVVGVVLLAVGLKFKKTPTGSKEAPASATLVPRLGPGHAGLGLVGRF